MSNAKPDPRPVADTHPNEDSGLLFILFIVLLLTVVVVLTA